MVDRQAVMKALERIRPLFIEHQGDFQVQEITDDGIVRVKLIGECELCVLKEKTTRAVETILKAEVPGVMKVEPV